MISHIHSATVIVSNQDAALDFYVNTLGWEKVLDVPMGETDRFITVVPPGATTQLALAPSHWFSQDRTPGGETGISVVSPDIEKTYKTLTDRGVEFKEPPTVQPWGMKATWFYDQDGNELFLAEGS